MGIPKPDHLGIDEYVSNTDVPKEPLISISFRDIFDKFDPFSSDQLLIFCFRFLIERLTYFRGVDSNLSASLATLNLNCVSVNSSGYQIERLCFPRQFIGKVHGPFGNNRLV
jgi:hypothetical protein